MGYYSELMIDQMNNYKTEAIAEALGIEFEDLEKQDFDLIPIETNDGLITSYRLVFAEETPVDFLQTIPGLEGFQVELGTEVIANASEFDYEYEAISSNRQLLETFEQEIDNLKKLNAIDLADQELNKILLRQIYIGVVGSMETFLSETFLKLTFSNPDNLERFVKNHPEFKNQKFEVREVFEVFKNINETAKRIILDMIYHNLSPVREMYRTTFNIEFPKIAEPIKCVRIRHDLVHRNGKTKDQQEVILDRDTVERAIVTISDFIHEIADNIEGDQFELPF